MSASEFFSHKFNTNPRKHLVFLQAAKCACYTQYIKKLELLGLTLKSYFYMVEYCGNFWNGNCENYRSIMYSNSYFRRVYPSFSFASISSRNLFWEKENEKNFKKALIYFFDKVLFKSCYANGQFIHFSKTAQPSRNGSELILVISLYG